MLGFGAEKAASSRTPKAKECLLQKAAATRDVMSRNEEG